VDSRVRRRLVGQDGIAQRRPGFLPRVFELRKPDRYFGRIFVNRLVVVRGVVVLSGMT
jgi:hypothetical protein